MATATLIGPEPSSASPKPNVEGQVYRCVCGNALRVFGLGRHRVYFERDETGSEDAVLGRVCPACHRALPGKNAG